MINTLLVLKSSAVSFHLYFKFVSQGGQTDTPTPHLTHKQTEEVSRWMRTLSSSFCRISIFEWRILSDLCFLAGQIWKVTLTQWRNMKLITSRTSFRKYRCYSMFRISLNLTTFSCSLQFSVLVEDQYLIWRKTVNQMLTNIYSRTKSKFSFSRLSISSLFLLYVSL